MDNITVNITEQSEAVAITVNQTTETVAVTVAPVVENISVTITEGGSSTPVANTAIVPLLSVVNNGDNTFNLNTTLNFDSILTGSPLIVGMGSSTMNGTGPTTPANELRERIDAWVTANTTGGTFFEVATNGYTTNKILPDSSGDSTTDPHANITAIAGIGADIVLVALTSNDQADSANTAQEFVDNCIAIQTEAEKYGVNVFFTTTAPRTGYNSTERDRLLEARTLMLAQMDNSRIVDIMPDLAVSLTGTDRATIKPEYNSGDDIHFTDAGHGVIFDKFIEVLTAFYIADLTYDRLEIERSTSATTGFTSLVSDAALTQAQTRVDGTQYYYRSRIRYSDLTYSSYSNVVGLQQSIEAGSVDQTVRINFSGASVAESGYNNWVDTSPAIGDSITNLNDSTGSATGINATIINQDFNGTGTSGELGGSSYPDNVIDNYWLIDGTIQEEPGIRLTNLSSSHTYNITLITSRDTNQINRYTSLEVNNASDGVMAGNNTGTEVAVVNGVVPNGSGELDINFKAPIYEQGHVNGLIIERRSMPAAAVQVTLSSDAVTVTDYSTTVAYSVVLSVDVVTVTDYSVSVSSVDAFSQVIVPFNTVSNSTGSNPRGYVISYPAGYNTRNDWPVIVEFHGLGDGGDGSTQDLTDHILNSRINSYVRSNDVPFVVVSPQDQSGSGYFSGSPTRMETFINFIREELSSKTNEYNWHCTYLSASGDGWANWVEDNTTNFQAMASHTISSALTGNGSATEYTNAVNSNAGFWFHHQLNDGTVGSGAPNNYFEGIVDQDGEGEDFTRYRFTMYNESGHSAWDKVYDNSGQSDPQVTGDVGNGTDYYNWTTGSWYDWLLSREKTPGLVLSTDAVTVTDYSVTPQVTGSVEVDLALDAITVTDYGITIPAGSTVLMMVSLGRSSKAQTTDSGWTNWNENIPTSSDANLVIGSYTLSITNDFQSTSTISNTIPSPNNTGYPDNALDASWWDRYGGEITVSGLNDAETYNFKCMPMLAPSKTDISFVLDINGVEQTSVEQTPMNDGTNPTEVVVSDISPSSGAITIQIRGKNLDGTTDRFAGMAAFILEEN